MTSLARSLLNSLSSWTVSPEPSSTSLLKDAKADSACDLAPVSVLPLPSEAEAVDAISKLESAVDLIRFWDYPCEVHTVPTADNYVLTLHRIPGRRGETVSTASQPSAKPAVIVWHGLAISSEAWVCCPGGPTRNFAFVLADAGYDVWMANSRGNKYSMDSLHKDGNNSTDFWKFGLDEMANNDVRAVVEYVREKTLRKKVTYIGYSQGSALAFAALSMDEELNDHIDIFIAMAPAMRPKPVANAKLTYLVDKHWFQIITTGTFSHYHAGSEQSSFQATSAYSTCPPVPYPTKHITTPMHLFAGGRDNISDVDFMRKALPKNAVIEVVDVRSNELSACKARIPTLPGQDYEHMDFLWADSAKELAWDTIVKLIRNIQDK
ncbi:cholesterol esterase [Rhizophlyctis rosea]|nr:cholesterol esterase [Rhizophlyctis rosea]